MSNKVFKLTAEEIIELVPFVGYCFATDKITVEGLQVGYMYREEPDDENDSGWRFFSGTEEQDYLNNPEHIMVYNVNTIANYDKAIIPYLDSPFGIECERVLNSNNFQTVKS